MSVVINGTGSISGLSNVGGVSSAQSGSIIQTVQATFATITSTTTTTFVNTGLSLSITPQFSTSKILIFTNLMGIYASASNNYAGQRITRNGSSIIVFDHISGYSQSGGSGGSNAAFMYLDSPATTSSISYVLQINVVSGSGTITWCNDNFTSTMTAMEIAA